MKLNSSEFIKKYTEGEKKISENDDVLIELMEDISDSVDNASEAEIKRLEEEKAKLERDLEDQKEKYKARFLDSVSFPQPQVEQHIEEPEQKEIIDIKEI